MSNRTDKASAIAEKIVRGEVVSVLMADGRTATVGPKLQAVSDGPRQYVAIIWAKGAQSSEHQFAGTDPEGIARMFGSWIDDARRTHADPERLTAAEIAALREVLARGGLWSSEATLGRLSAEQPVRYTTLARLCHAGLVEWVQVARRVLRGHGRSAYPTERQEARYFVTGAGCLILNRLAA